MASFLLGYASTKDRRLFDAGTYTEKRPEIAAYVQDDFRVSQKLTLNLGLRWDLFVPWVEIEDRQSNFDASTGKFVIASPNAVINGVEVGRYLQTYSKRDVGPRLGFAYDLDGSGRTIVRGGFGVFWNFSPGGTSSSKAQNPPFLQATTLTTNLGTNLRLSDGFPPPPGVDPNRPPAGTTRSIFDIDFRDAYSQNWNLNVQRQFATNYLVEVAYVGSRGRQLPLKGNPNQARPTVGVTDQNVNRPYIRISPQLRTLGQLQSRGTLDYHGLLVKFQRRFANRFSFFNANPQSFSASYLEKAAALARVFRPYGIRVYLSANFAAPRLLGGLPTADPLDPAVAKWWREKAGEIYRLVPDFGGFLVKANSEGQPGPQDYGRTHADGANVLADAVAPHGGIVMWRAFVYDADVDPDRVKRAYKAFVPLDGRFRDNVFVQVKNGPLDFQPREPFHPLFGAMPRTPLMAELQITQEYLGHSDHLVYLAPMWKEFLDADTYTKGPGSLVAHVIDGTIHGSQRTGIAGVVNTRRDLNWCGHQFAQANWYAYGRLAWDPGLGAETIAEEWIRMTWTRAPEVVPTIRAMMLGSRETFVRYTMPLGLHHLIGSNHYAPMPENADRRRADWSAVYYHRADASGIGYDRTRKGSGAVDQYRSPLREQWSDSATTPSQLLLWFHRLPGITS